MKKRMLKAMLGLWMGISILTLGCSKEGANTSNGVAQQSKLDEIKNRGKLVVGVKYDLPLFGYKNPASGDVEGFEIDIAKALAKDLLGDESKVELKEANSKNRIEMLKNNDVDLLIGTLTITEERKKEIDFSDVYFEAGQTLLVPVNSQINSVKEISSEQTIVTAKGATAGQVIKDLGLSVPVKEYENWGEAFMALKNGKGDALMTHNSIMFGMIMQSKVDGKPTFKMVGDILTQDNYGLGIKKGNDDLVKYTNELIGKIKQDGTYDKIYNKWFGELKF